MFRSRVSTLARLLTAVTLTCLVGCPVPPVPCETDMDCNDGNACTGDACVGGICVHTDVVCEDGDLCTTDSCDPDTGCVFEPLVCDTGFACVDGSCPPGPDGECDEQSYTYTYHDFTLTDVCTEEDNWCGWADRPGKAVVYGEMSKVVQVPDSCEKLDVTISIPCNGWGEGLKGPDGSSAHIIVNGVIRAEPIDDTLDYHHEAFYRYEYCKSFVNTFDVTGEAQAELIIRMNGGASMDFQEATLRFY